MREASLYIGEPGWSIEVGRKIGVSLWVLTHAQCVLLLLILDHTASESALANEKESRVEFIL